MNSKMLLKKQLRSLGINLVQGNYVKKSDVVRFLEKTKVKGNRADKFRQITKTDESHLDESYLDESTAAKAFKSKVDKKLLKKYADKGQVWIEDFGDSMDDACDHCGKPRANKLVGVGDPKDISSLQDSDTTYSLGAKCLKDLKAEIGGTWKKWVEQQ